MSITNIKQSINDYEAYKGNSNGYNVFIKSLLNIDMILSAYIPIAIFLVLNSSHGLTTAYISTFFWSLFCQLYFRVIKKISDAISLILLLYSTCKLIFIYFVPVKILLTYSTIFGCGIYCILIVTLNLHNKPLLQLFAEKGNPAMLDWEFRKNPLYSKVWKETSNIWLLAFVIKAFIIYISLIFLTPNLGYIYIVMGTPFTILLIALSIWYPKHKWEKILYK